MKRELNRLLLEGHIVKVNEIKEDVFLQPTVITVKKDRSVKIALDARELNKNVVKDKYPMPKLHNLMDMIAENVGKGPGKTFFTTLDMTYAYGHVELSADTSRQCNFQIIGREATGVYKIVIGFYGLFTMPTEFQRIMDVTLTGISNTFSFKDGILIVTHGTEEEHIEKVKEVLKVLTRLDEANINLNSNSNQVEIQISWLSCYSSIEESEILEVSRTINSGNSGYWRVFLEFNELYCFEFQTSIYYIAYNCYIFAWEGYSGRKDLDLSFGSADQPRYPSSRQLSWFL